MPHAVKKAKDRAGRARPRRSPAHRIRRQKARKRAIGDFIKNEVIGIRQQDLQEPPHLWLAQAAQAKAHAAQAPHLLDQVRREQGRSAPRRGGLGQMPQERGIGGQPFDKRGKGRRIGMGAAIGKTRN